MEVRTTARRVKVTSSVQEHLEQRLTKLQRYLPELNRASVKLSQEKHRFRVEIILHVRHKDRVAQEESDDLTAAIDGATTRLERQLKRLKGKTARVNSRRSANGAVPRSAARAALGISTGSRKRAASPPSTAKRLTAKPRPEEPFDIVRVRMPASKPISADEAAQQLMESDQEFLVFLDSRSERPCVLYRRSDGRLGLIEARR